MNKILLLLIFFKFTSIIYAQDTVFEAKVSNDTILDGNYLIIRYDIINTNGDFIAPGFNDFIVISGPNTSSLFSMKNGQTTQKLSYAYYLEPKKEGELYIEPAYLYMRGDTLETPPLKIIVLPNPEGEKIIPKMENEQPAYTYPEYNGHPLQDMKKKYRKKKNKKKIKTRKI